MQFANGVAEIGEGSLVNWFREHEGYEVTEVPEVEAAKAAQAAQGPVFWPGAAAGPVVLKADGGRIGGRIAHAGSPKVAKVNYPGLESSPYHKLQLKYLPKGAGSIFSIELKDGFDAARKFIDNLEIFSNLANVGDSKSLVVHPASTTHQQLSPEAQQAAGITPGAWR